MNEIPYQAVRTWMFEAALPFWGAAGVDRDGGGFHEELDLEGRPTGYTFKRTRVICRQIYVFSHAGMLGWGPGAALAAHGQDFLLRHAWLGPDRGWARQLSRTGAVLDPTPDLYDMAFVLFALAWRYRHAGDSEALAYAHRTLDFIETRMRQGEGFAVALPPQGCRQQNPHMHLLEACIALYETNPDARFLRLAAEIVTLFERRFFDGRTLGEFFAEDWSRAPGEAGRVVEPGHQFEWAWILTRYRALSGRDVAAPAAALTAFAERHGVDPVTQLTYNQVRDDGAALDSGSRTWPNTERIKAHLALFELTGADPRPAVSKTIAALFVNHLKADPAGSWIDRVDAARRPVALTAPTSTLYHLFLAFAEVLRLQGAIEAALR
jgi:mannose/cellobiose epimerase-like protein (N-acyl-D-glucosamine 2-epimerase family)